MLGIYARTFMTATGQNKIPTLSQPKNSMERRRWLPSGHWYLERPTSKGPTQS
jgi:hypothetical protein